MSAATKKGAKDRAGDTADSEAASSKKSAWATLRENGLVELEVVREVAPCLVVNRSAYQHHRRELNNWLDRFEAVGVAE